MQQKLSWAIRFLLIMPSSRNDSEDGMYTPTGLEKIITTPLNTNDYSAYNSRDDGNYHTVAGTTENASTATTFTTSSKSYEVTPILSVAMQASHHASAATNEEILPIKGHGGMANNPGGFGALGENYQIDITAATQSYSTRVPCLILIDSSKWHYSIMGVLLMNFIFELLAIVFSSNQAQANSTSLYSASLLASNIFIFVYVIDMLLRIRGLHFAFLRSNSTVADLSLTVLLIGLLIYRNSFRSIQKVTAMVYFILLAIRIIVKPRARIFSERLHKFGPSKTNLKVGMDSVRAALRRVPGITPMAIEMMEIDLTIVCGRSEGDMTREELMRVLERALLYRPRELTATEFLGYLQDVGAQSIRHAYGAIDVIHSTFWHWSFQLCDLFLSLLVVCMNASIIPLQAYFIEFMTSETLELHANTLNGITSSRTSMTYAVMGILLLTIPAIVGNYSIGYFQSKMIAKATEKLQQSLLDTILHQETEFFIERSEGDLNNLFSSDIARVNALWQSIYWNLLNPLVSIVFAFVFLLARDWPTGVVAFAFTAVLLSTGPQEIAANKSREFGSLNAFATAEFQNAIFCHKVIRVYSIQASFLERFNKTLDRLRSCTFAKDFWASVVQIYVETAMYVFVAVITASLAIKTANNEIQPATFFSFITLLSRISTPVTVLGGFMRVAIGNASSLQRLDKIIFGPRGPSGDEKHHDVYELPQLSRLQNSLKLHNLYFKYDKLHKGEYTLSNLSACIEKGSFVGVCGPSGSGKSTLLGCLMQLLPVDSGTILLDDCDVTMHCQASLMQQIAVVFQDILILNGTILDNIRYGNIRATDDECIEAALLAECTFIGSLRDGFNTVIGQHASCNLSGGQAQRVCLARALCRKPSLLLLDEATSSLDPETELSIVNTLERLRKKVDMTIISVTHRLKTIRHANKILVMNEGRVVESGTYEDLVQDQTTLFFEMLRAEENHIDKAPKYKTCISVDESAAEFTCILNSTPVAVGNEILLEEFSKGFTARKLAVPTERGSSEWRRNRFGSATSNLSSIQYENSFNFFRPSVDSFQ